MGSAKRKSELPILPFTISLFLSASLIRISSLETGSHTAFPLLQIRNPVLTLCTYFRTKFIKVTAISRSPKRTAIPGLGIHRLRQRAVHRIKEAVCKDASDAAIWLLSHPSPQFFRCTSLRSCHTDDVRAKSCVINKNDTFFSSLSFRISSTTWA